MSVKGFKRYILSDEEKQFYEDNGYLVIKRLIDPSELEVFRGRFLQYAKKEIPRGKVAVIEDVNLKKTVKNPEDYVNKINLLGFDEVFMRYSEHPVLLDVLAQIFGEEGIKVVNSMLINKPPGSPWHPPHQDMFNLPLKPFDKVLITWTAIDHATLENGCLFVVPGSHKAKKIFEEELKEDLVNNLFYSISDVNGVAPEEQRVTVPMEPGDTIFIKSLCIHGSLPNKSQKYRKAMTCVYGAGSTEFSDVTGTVQELFAIHFTEEMEKRGHKQFNFVDYWRNRTKFINCASS